MNATALIAEDEPLLAAALQAELARLWPALRIVASVGHGEAAVQEALRLKPELLFLDIRMPGMSGLEAAQALAEDWPDEGRPFPLIVFVTAYDQYALQAFERAAVDYVLKPVQPERLAQTCARAQSALRLRQATPATASSIHEMIDQLRSLVGSNADAAPRAAQPLLRVIQAGAGNAVHLIPIDEVVYFEAADKYVRVITAVGEHLIRTSLRELHPQLDPQRFWQIHRGTIVRCDAIDRAVRDDAGKVSVQLRSRPEKLAVSRLYTHLFQAM